MRKIFALLLFAFILPVIGVGIMPGQTSVAAAKKTKKSVTMKGPDFAYPKTVSKNAMADLDNALKKHNAADALVALVQYSLAQGMIDENEVQKCIKLTEDAAGKFEDDKLHGMYLLFLAKLYCAAYSGNRWVYDRREIPLTPYPEDVTEWSGEQFKARVTALLQQAISAKEAQGLGNCRIADYASLVSCDPLAAEYFPTLLDFAYVQARDMGSLVNDKEFSDNIIKLAVSGAADGSAPSVYWQAQGADNNRTASIKKLFDKYSANPYAGYLLTLFNPSDCYEEIALSYDYDDVPEIDPVPLTEWDNRRWYCAAAEAYLKAFPDCAFKTSIKSLEATCKQKSVECKVPDLVAVNTAFTVNVRNCNTAAFAVNVYRLTDSEAASQRLSSKNLQGRRPVLTKEVACAEVAPFCTDTTVTFELSEPGYYVVMPNIPGYTSQDYHPSTLRCLSLFPMMFCGTSQATMIVADPHTGAPVANVGTTVVENKSKKVLCSGTTDSIGVSRMYGIKSDTYNNYTVLSFAGKNYQFSNIGVHNYTDRVRPGVNYCASVLTDRSIYHLGEEISILAVITETETFDASRREERVSPGRDVELCIYDANYQLLETITGKSDEFGRVSSSFKLPHDGMTGYFRVEVCMKDSDGSSRSYRPSIGSKRVMVSDFKMPDFEIEVKTTSRNVPSEGDVTIEGVATTYSGMPLAGVKLDVTVSGSSWRYWWRAETKIHSLEAVTEADGSFRFTVPDSVLSAAHYDFFLAEIDATSSTGSSAETSTSFSTGKQYYITLDLPSLIVDGQMPLKPEVKIIAPDGSEKSFATRWSILKDNDVVASGDFNGEIDLAAITPGRYTLCVVTEDESLADKASAFITIYNTATDIVPTDEAIWVKDSEVTAIDADTCSLLFGTPDDADVYVVVNNPAGDILQIEHMKVVGGYHTADIDCSGADENLYVKFICVRDCNVSYHNVTISSQKTSGLVIEGETFRDRLLPGSMETWKIKVSGTDGNAVRSALLLDMYNKALEAILPHSLGLQRSYISVSNPLSFNKLYLYRASNEVMIPVKTEYTDFSLPSFNFYGYSLGFPGYYSLDFGTSYTMAPPTAGAMPRRAKFGAAALNSEMAVKESDGAPYPEPAQIMMDAEEAEEEEAENDFEYRSEENPLAVWAPSLTTDDAGNITYTFTVPNENTTWRLRALAWTSAMEVGSMMRDFVASKPVMVMPNLPRFLRVGDKANIITAVLNNTDEQQAVTTTIEIFNPITSEVIASKKYSHTLAAKESTNVEFKLDVDGTADAIGFRVKTSNGKFADGEQAVIRVLPNMASLVETQPFYLNPGEKEYSTKLPKGKNARIALTFCENPMWTIVSAIPGLRAEIHDYANSAAAAIFSACIADGIVKSNPLIAETIDTWLKNPSDSALVSMLQKNEDLKIALLNSTPWVQSAQNDTERMGRLALIFNSEENRKAVARAVEILADLQNSDGGWKWGKWCDKSSEWVTGNVLAMMAELRTLGWMPADSRLSKMVEKALRYWDSKVEDTDLIYSIVRPQFAESKISANGRKVIDATLKDIRANWKMYTSVARKAMAAEALYLNNDKTLARQLMESVSEFGVMTPSQGLKFPSDNSLSSYAILLEAYSMIVPGAPEIDGIRQYLIMRKQATDWGTAVVTSEVVQSMILSGSNWLVEARGAMVKADGKIITPSLPIETATGSLRADLSKYAGKELTILTTGEGPAYGAVYARFDKKMEDVKASSIDDLDIEKTLLVRRGTDWEHARDLKVGDRVKVQLTIHCKRNMEYVSIIDERPATFSPVDQLPGWMWSEGVGFYRENRDSATTMHVVYMSPGTYLLSYEMNVGVAGTFTSGVATIQSQYAPELTAHSSGCVIEVK